jgi:hypothetical protein
MEAVIHDFLFSLIIAEEHSKHVFGIQPTTATGEELRPRDRIDLGENFSGCG